MLSLPSRGLEKVQKRSKIDLLVIQCIPSLLFHQVFGVDFQFGRHWHTSMHYNGFAISHQPTFFWVRRRCTFDQRWSWKLDQSVLHYSTDLGVWGDFSDLESCNTHGTSFFAVFSVCWCGLIHLSKSSSLFCVLPFFLTFFFCINSSTLQTFPLLQPPLSPVPSGLRLAPPFAREEAEKTPEPEKRYRPKGWKDWRADVSEQRRITKPYCYFSPLRCPF